jgi:hypothetical protein
MSRQPPTGGDSTWKGLAIIVVAVALGFVVFQSFPKAEDTTAAGAVGRDQPRETTTTLKPGAAVTTTSTSIPLKDNKDVKVLVANGTATTGATRKIVDALKPACYAMQNPVDAIAKVKSENRPQSTVYSTPGYEREAALIATKLQLPQTANAALPADLPIPSKGQPSYNVLILVAKDLVEKPPEPLPGAECGTATTTAGGSTAKTTTTKKATVTTAASKATTTTKAITTTSRQPTTTAP